MGKSLSMSRDDVGSTTEAEGGIGVAAPPAPPQRQPRRRKVVRSVVLKIKLTPEERRKIDYLASFATLSLTDAVMQSVSNEIERLGVRVQAREKEPK